MKIKYANKIYDVLYTMKVLGKLIYAVEDEPNHIDWLVNVEVIDEEESKDEEIRKWIIDDIRYNINNEPLNNSEYTKKAKKAIAWLEKQGKETSEKEFTFKSLPRLLEMIEVSDRAKAYTEKLAVTLDNKGYHTDAKIVRERIKIMNGEEVSMATMDEQKPVNKVEPKFKIKKDNWYVCIRNLDDDYGTRAFHKDDIYHSTKDETLIPDNSNVPYEIKYCAEDYFRLWTIEDAKDGDILWHSDTASNGIFIFKKIRDDGKVLCYCDYDSEDHFCTGEHHTCCWITDKCIKPATKEQRELLFQKMKEAGFKWDEEKKELKKLEKQNKQKLIWDKFDDLMLKDMIEFIESGWSGNGKSHLIYWLKSIKDRIK